MNYLRSKSLVKRKKCKECGKNRKIESFDTPRSLYCKMCKVSLAYGKKKEAKKQTNKFWIKKLDAIVGSKIRARRLCDSPRSHVCNKRWQWAHGLSRSYHQTRWDENNGFCLCNKEHLWFTYHPLEWDEFLRQTWGEDEYDRLRKKALDHSDKIDYEELFNKLKEGI